MGCWHAGGQPCLGDWLPGNPAHLVQLSKVHARPPKGCGQNKAWLSTGESIAGRWCTLDPAPPTSTLTHAFFCQSSNCEYNSFSGSFEFLTVTRLLGLSDVQPLLAERARKRTVARPSQEGSPLTQQARETGRPQSRMGCRMLWPSVQRDTPAPIAGLGTGCGLQQKDPAGTGQDRTYRLGRLYSSGPLSSIPWGWDWGPGGPWPSLETTLVSVVACRWRKTTSFTRLSGFLYLS